MPRTLFKLFSRHSPIEHDWNDLRSPTSRNVTKSWLAIVQLACELVAWTQMLALTDHPARRWEPKRLRLRLWSIAGRITHHARYTAVNFAA